MEQLQDQHKRKMDIDSTNQNKEEVEHPKKKMESALQLEVLATWKKARVTKLKLPHHVCDTPMFMPVGTQGTIKGLTTEQLEELDCHVILGNTYHLGHRPGADVVDSFGGLHSFMNWKRGLLTDSGGFQMVSLLKLAEITEEGVTFLSPHDGSKMLLTPEHSIQIQNKIGADIIMALDDVVSSTTTGPRVIEAMDRTLRWIDRCIKAHGKPHCQNLFGIVQGGLDSELRDKCLDAMIERDLPGYAIGGLSGGESKDLFWKVVNQCTSKLPKNKPRYLMGVGYPVDLVVCSILGVGSVDCETDARFGTALVPEGTLHLRQAEYAKDLRPISKECSCKTCKTYTRAYLHALEREETLAQLLSFHNIAYQMQLMRSIRQAITENRVEEFVKNFMKLQFPDEKYPSWVVDALASTGIQLIDKQ